MKTAFLLLVLTCAGQAFAQPRLIYQPDTVNFGRAAPGYLNARVSLQNIGSDTLEFLHVATNTGAMTAVMGRIRLGPQDTTSMFLTYDGYNKRYGPFRKCISIVTNESGGTGYWHYSSNGHVEEKHYTLPVIGVIGPPHCTRTR